MKKIQQLVLFLSFLMIGLGSIAQQKKVVAKKSIAEPSFAGLIPVSEIKDLLPGHTAYESVKVLHEQYQVPMAYSNNTFRGNTALSRGEFIIHFNSALESSKHFIDSIKLDTSLINTYDKNASYITSVSQIKDLKSTSVYYPAVKSLIEDWGIAANFTKARLLGARSGITEADVYDILRVTMGYDNAAVSKRKLVITRNAFATMLADAMTQLRSRAIRLPKPVPDKVSDTMYIQLPFEPKK